MLAAMETDAEKAKEEPAGEDSTTAAASKTDPSQVSNYDCSCSFKITSVAPSTGSVVYLLHCYRPIWAYRPR